MKSKSPKILNDASMSFIKKYLDNPSPVGHEANGQKIWLDYIKPYIDEYFVDAYGTTVGVINPKAKYKVVLEAHADEISWYVKYITEEGMIYVCKNGGSDQLIAPSMRVHIHTRNGDIVKGVFGWPAIHTRTSKDEKKPKTDTIWIDVGAKNKQEVHALGIKIGNVVTYADSFEIMQHDYWTARAFDNRIGGVMIAEVARLLKESKTKLPFGLYLVNAVQEEVGMLGAGMIVETIEPDIAIVTDVTHDTNTPMMNKMADGDVSCGKGPVLNIAPSIHNKLLDIIENVAIEKKIPYQLEVSSGGTGTDADAFAYGSCGGPSALVSLPLRYMHTSVETICKSDVEQTILLLYEVVQKLNPKTNYKYL